jgi:hypothetical protein
MQPPCHAVAVPFHSSDLPARFYVENVYAIIETMSDGYLAEELQQEVSRRNARAKR